MKLLIPNVTGPTNFGDQAILLGLLNVLKTHVKREDILIHSTDPDLYRKDFRYKTSASLSHYLVLEDKTVIGRIIRLTEFILIMFWSRILTNTHFYNIFQLVLNKRKIWKIIEDYLKADVIIFVGGGYLRSKKGIMQSLNLILQLAIFQLAKMTKKPTIATPMSFGPFAYEWQAKLAASVLNGLDIIAARESFSYRKLKNLSVSNIILSSDQALLMKPINHKIKRENIVGFTIRNWLEPNSQLKFERAYCEALETFHKKTGLELQPIIQVTSPDFPKEDDRHITNKIYRVLKNNHVTIRKPYITDSIDKAKQIYSSLSMLLGMRMHSNIIAATQLTPFVAISYEYKTIGIANQLGVGDYCIDCKKVTAENLYFLLFKAYKNIRILESTIVSNLERIQQEETEKWNKIIKRMMF